MEIPVRQPLCQTIKSIESFTSQNAQPTNVVPSVKHVIITGEIQIDKGTNPVLCLWVISGHFGIDNAISHKLAQQMNGWGQGDVAVCFLSVFYVHLLLTFPLTPHLLNGAMTFVPLPPPLGH